MTDYDSPWKQMLAQYFPEFLAFFFPKVHAGIVFHCQHGKLATVAAVQPPGRYGAVRMDGQRVAGFTEKPRGDGGLINGGFFVVSPKVIDLIDSDQPPGKQNPWSDWPRWAS